MVLPVGRHPPEPIEGPKVRLRPHPTLLSLPPRGRDPSTDEQGSVGPHLPPKTTVFPSPRLRPYKKAPPLSKEVIATALAKCSPKSPPGPDAIPYSTWKQFNKINPSVLLQILSPLLSLGYHPVLLKGSNGIVLHKAGKPFDESCLLQDNSPNPHVFEDSRENNSIPPLSGGQIKGSAQPQPMLLPAWAQHISCGPPPLQRRKDPTKTMSQDLVHVLGHTTRVR